jgi:hypothetical protein
LLIDIIEFPNDISVNQKIINFYEKHDKTVEKIIFFCKIEDIEFYPLGEESKPFLYKGIELKNKK